MKRLISLSLVILWPLAASWAQLAAPNEMGVAMGHMHFIVRDVAAEKKIWAGLGGTPIKIDGTDVIKFPGLFVFISQGIPVAAGSGGQGVCRAQTSEGQWTNLPCSANDEGSVINQVLLDHWAGHDMLSKLEGQGVRVLRNNPSEADNGVVWTSEGKRIDNNQNSKLMVPAEPVQIQFAMPRYARRTALAWYVQHFGMKPVNPGGQPGDRISFGAANPIPRPVGVIPGLRQGLVFGEPLGAAYAPQPTKGHTLDHIGFEVKNLEALCKKLEEMGILFDAPYSKNRHASFASAELTDPWGTSIELTEGLSQF